MSTKQPEAFPDMPMGDKSAPRLHARRPVPWLCYGYMAVCIALYVLGLEAFTGLHADWLNRFGLFLPDVEAGEWWRIFSCHFLHGNIVHVSFNMFVLYSLGRSLEVHIGRGLFLWASVLGALGTAVSSMLFSPHALMVGASGVIISWAGVMIPLATRHARKELLIWFAQIAVLSLLPGISLAGHAGGAVAGLVCGVALLQFLKGRRGWLLWVSILFLMLCLWAARPISGSGVYSV
jgi:membrane associated rhomboid family serine protease